MFTHILNSESRDHQEPHLLDKLLSDTLPLHSPNISEDAADSIHPDRATHLCACVTRYCGYRDSMGVLESKSPYVFDDPYVGAAILTSKGKVLGSHRKAASGEAHAEVQSICDAVDNIAKQASKPELNHAAKDLLAEIDSAYSQSLWLQSEANRRDFLALFSRAGDLVRKAFPDTKLAFVSSLEPCRDFESNPACAHIISAFKPDYVLYGCDDTNEKGQGRQVMKDAGLTVYSNCAVEENLTVNALFYAAVDAFIRIGTPTTPDGHLALRYTIADIGCPPDYSIDSQSGRLHLDFDNVRSPVYQVLVDAASNTEHEEPPQLTRPAPCNSRIVLFANRANARWTVDWLKSYCTNTNQYPALIVYAEPSHSAEAGAISQILEKPKISAYFDAMIRHVRHAQEASAIFRDERRRSGSSSVVLVARHHREAQPKEEHADQLTGAYEVRRFDTAQADEKVIGNMLDYLAHAKAPQKLSLFFASAHLSVVARFLEDALRPANNLVDLGNAAITAYLVEVNDADAARIDDDPVGRISRTNPRVTYRGYPAPLRSIHGSTAKGLASQVKAGIVDPFTQILIDSKETLGSINNGWLERKALAEVIADAAWIDLQVFEHIKTLLNLKAYNPTNPYASHREHFSRLCIALNAISRIGKRTASAQRVGSKGAESRSIAQTILKDFIAAYEPILEGTSGNFQMQAWCGVKDVVWRLIAAVTNCADGPDDFIDKINDALKHAIAPSPFLLKEYIYYLSTLANRFEQDQRAILDEIVRSLNTFQSIDSEDLGRRVARVANVVCSALAPILVQELSGAKWAIRRKFIAGYLDETKNITLVRDLGILSVSIENHSRKALPTILPLIGFDKSRRGVTPIELLSALVAESDRSLAASLTSWRGDLRATASLVLSLLPPHARLDALEHMANDCDESVRWSVLYVLGQSPLRDQLWNPQPTPAVAVPLRGPEMINVHAADETRSRLVHIVQSSLKIQGHFASWMAREFIALLQWEFRRRKVRPTASTLRVSDFGEARQLLGPSPFEKIGTGDIAGELDPDFESLRSEVRRTIRRVLLVLPPIEFEPIDSSSEYPASPSSSPPLGLGSIATHLCDAGHDVYLVDCFRYPELVERTIEVSRDFDCVAFSVVISTVSSTLAIASKMRERAGRKLRIVVGGHAASLLGVDYWRSLKSQVDNLITGAGESALLQLIETGSIDSSKGIFDLKRRSENTESVREEGSHDWPSVFRVDRRVFLDSTGRGTYEPSKQNRVAASEAHVVMSRGCEWRCSFCTEWKHFGGIESRRSVMSVIEEVRDLHLKRSVGQIQFIDDNLLPQIASATHKDKDASLAWVRDFIDSLLKIKAESPSFRWRGIFRFEDLRAYLDWDVSFVEKLQRSGCFLLAFGVEKANFDLRKRLKGGSTVSNEEIVNIIRKVREAGILAKGYFIIGGKDSTDSDARDNAEFAIATGFDVAYFAIYKDFMGVHSKSRALDNSTSRRYITQAIKFKELKVSLLDEIGSALNTSLRSANASLVRCRDAEYLRSDLEEHQKAFIELESLGFSFQDLFKYSDYHDIDTRPRGAGNAGAWDVLGFSGDKSRLLGEVIRAYLLFYGRSTFVEQFQRMRALGY